MNKHNEVRVDAASKIAGLEKYTRDLHIENALLAGTVRSSKAHARIASISFDEVFDWAKVTILSAKDITNNFVAIIKNDMPYLAKEEVNYIGEPILLLAAENEKILLEAKKHITIEYEELTAACTLGAAIERNNTDGLFEEIYLENGEIEETFSNAGIIVEDTFETGFQEHVYLEPQVVVAIPEGSTIHVKGSMQCPYYVQNAMNELFRGTEIKVDVTQIMTGGAFGGKEDFPSLICGHVALLAWKTGRPIILSYNREEDIQFTTKRHPSKIHAKAAVDTEGKLLALDMDILLDSGAYTTLSPVVLARSVLTSFGCYSIPNVRIHGRAIKTNISPCGAFRGFGGPQSLFAMEMLVEKIAQTMNIPVWRIKKANMLSVGDKLPTGQPINYSYGLPQCVEKVLSSSGYEQKFKEFKKYNETESKKYGILKGIGISLAAHGCGFTGLGENRIKAIAAMELLSNGKVLIKTANTEMGQGVDTAYKIIVSEKLHLPFEDIIIEEKNTSKVPNSGPTVASRSTMIVGKLLLDNCEQILNALSLKDVEFTLQDFNEATTEYYKNHKKLSVQKEYKHPNFIKFNEETYKGYGYPVYSWSANVAEVEIDLTSYQVQVKKFYSVHDVGKAINHQQSEGQIQGGIIQGIGYAIYEALSMENGEVRNRGFRDYIIPTIQDIPEMRVEIVEAPYFNGPYGAKALGELPLVGAAPAVASAVSFAIGKTATKIPMTPEVIATLIEKSNYEY
ncbi:MAG: xanthine dehydrogenase family protein molybdopterin-binding subunit [Candidatus Celaenobacter antarcticus]|nr:xanthine dehydrogenase family protein molybdopterin-binding subunit [Candidatus Celaenobacter antarcticus]